MSHLDYAIIEIQAEKNLPDHINLEIGKIVSSWAVLEFALKNIIFDIMDVSQQEGRIAVKDKGASNLLDTIRELLNFKNITVETNLISLKTDIEKIQGQRNNITHNVWVIHPETKKYCLGLVRGKRSDDSKIKRILVPEPMPFDLEFFQDLQNNINTIISRIETLINELEPHFPSS